MNINQEIEKKLAAIATLSEQASTASEVWQADETDENWQRYEQAQDAYLSANTQLTAVLQGVWNAGYRLVNTKDKST